MAQLGWDSNPRSLAGQRSSDVAGLVRQRLAELVEGSPVRVQPAASGRRSPEGLLVGIARPRHADTDAVSRKL